MSSSHSHLQQRADATQASPAILSLHNDRGGQHADAPHAHDVLAGDVFNDHRLLDRGPRAALPDCPWAHRRRLSKQSARGACLVPGRAPSPTLVLAARQARAPAEAREEAVLAHCERVAVARRALSVSPAMPGNPRAACRGRVRHRPSCPAHVGRLPLPSALSHEADALDPRCPLKMPDGRTAQTCESW